MTARPLSAEWIHLGLGGGAEPLRPFDGMDWYEDYGRRYAPDGADGRLVSQFSFAESWNSWEMHPAGAEVVICTAGRMTLVQEFPDGELRTVLQAGQYAINPPGVWHTADTDGETQAIFITSGIGTQHRPR